MFKDGHWEVDSLRKKYGNIFGLHLGSRYVVFVCDRDSVKEALSHNALLLRPVEFPLSSNPEGSVITLNGSMWQEHRRFFIKMFKRLGAGSPVMEAHIQKELSYLLSELKARNGEPLIPPHVLIGSVSNVMTMVLASRRFGQDHPQRAHINDFIEVVVLLSTQVLAVNFFPLLRSVFSCLGLGSCGRLRERISSQNSLHREGTVRNFTDGFISEMKSRQLNETFTREMLIGDVGSFIGGGTGTMGTALEWLLVMSAAHPHQQSLVTAETDAVMKEKEPGSRIQWSDRLKMPYAQAFIWETLRCKPVNPLALMRWLHLGSRYVVFLCDYDSVKEALSHNALLCRPEEFPLSANPLESLITLNGPIWQEHRRFFMKIVKELGSGTPLMEAHIQKELSHLLGELNARNGEPIIPLDLLTTSVSNIMTVLLASRRIGSDHPQRANLNEAIQLVVALSGQLSAINFFPWLRSLFSCLGLGSCGRLRGAFSYRTRFTEQIISDIEGSYQEGTVRNFADGFISKMRNRSEENKTFTRKLLIGHAASFISAGTGTTSTALELLLVMSAAKPHQQNLVRAETDAVIEEKGAGSRITWNDRLKMPYAQAFIWETMRCKPISPLNLMRWLHLGSRYVVFLCDYDSVEQALSHHALLCRPEEFPLCSNPTESLITLNGPIWQEHRRFFLKMLKELGSGTPVMEAHIQKELSHLLGELNARNGDPIIPLDLLTTSASNIMTMLLASQRFGPDHPQRANINEAIQLVMALSDQLMAINFFPWLRSLFSCLGLGSCGRLRGAFSRRTRFTEEIMSDIEGSYQEGTVRNFADGFISKMRNRSEGNETFTRQLLIGHAASFISAGTGSTSTALEWLLAMSAAKPHQQNLVRAETDAVIEEKGPGSRITWNDRLKMPYAQAFIWETMRCKPISPLNLMRWLHLGSRYVVFLCDYDSVEEALSHNALLCRPEEFPLCSNPTQRKRSCPGESIANMVVFVYFTNILHHFTVEASNNGVQLDDEVLGLTMRPEPRELVFTPRK
ncbi:hypothetical protein MTO96_049421 [Rhipicephalus appendiculatus]